MTPKVQPTKEKDRYKLIAGEGVEKREPSYTVGGNIIWYNHYGEHCRGFFKKKSCHMIQQTLSWAYVQRTP